MKNHLRTNSMNKIHTIDNKDSRDGDSSNCDTPLFQFNKSIVAWIYNK